MYMQVRTYTHVFWKMYTYMCTLASVELCVGKTIGIDWIWVEFFVEKTIDMDLIWWGCVYIYIDLICVCIYTLI